MKRLSFVLFLLVVWTGARAQDALARFSDRAETSLVSFSYSFSVKGDVPVQGKGTVSVQGDSFRLSGNGLDIFCDGTTRWTADNNEKELIIEDISGAGSDLYSNPALLVTSSGSSFDRVSVSDASFGGNKVKAFRLVPREDDGFEAVTLFFKGDTLAGAAVEGGDGSITEFTISSLSFASPGDPGAFSYDVSSCDGSWVITDLR